MHPLERHNGLGSMSIGALSGIAGTTAMSELQLASLLIFAFISVAEW